MVQALGRLVTNGKIDAMPVLCRLAAISVGIVNGNPMLDLNYSEDSSAEVDLNVVMTDSNEFVEIQGTAERQPFNQNQLNDLLQLAENGIGELIKAQSKAIGIKAT